MGKQGPVAKGLPNTLVAVVNLWYKPLMTQDNNNHELGVLEDRLGYYFKDKGLLTQALSHRSWAVEQGGSVQDNELLEFMGDAVLELAVSDLLFARYGDQCREGELTKMRSFLVNETQLSSLARRIDLGNFLLLGRGEDKSGGRNKSSILADAFEAVMGAVYLDSGMDTIFDLVERLMGGILDDAREMIAGYDFKTRLQEFTQSRFHRVPEYKVEKISGPDHQRTFHIALYLNGSLVATGTGRSKKAGEQAAARMALDKLGSGEPLVHSEDTADP